MSAFIQDTRSATAAAAKATALQVVDMLTRPPSDEELDAARQLLLGRRDAASHDHRRLAMGLVERAAARMAPRQYSEFMEAADSDAAPDGSRGPPGVLRYLVETTDSAASAIHGTVVESGLALWHIYNMGYVFKTPTLCFGVDVKMPDAKRLASSLDFLLVSHEHVDHRSPRLLEAMLADGKPVITNWDERTIVPNGAQTCRFGDATVKITLGDHGLGRTDTVLMFQIECNCGLGDIVIYHTGDCVRPRKMRPDRPVTIFIPRLTPDPRVEREVRQVGAEYAFPSHAMELGHRRMPFGLRWPWSVVCDRFGVPAADGIDVLTWGERWGLPGSRLVTAD